MKLDDNDLKIIRLLQQDSRLPIREISKKTGIRPSTVHVRIQRLLSEGIIENFTLKLNHARFGDNFVVFMLMNTSRDLDRRFLEQGFVKEVYGVTGEFDLLVKLRFKNVEEFNNFLIDLRNQSEITKTLTMVATIGVKEEI